MDTDRNLEEILELLAVSYSSGDKVRGYLDECRSNVRLEGVCIVMCEMGELFSEVIAYNASMPHMNEFGLLGGILFGGGYALHHTFKHGKAHNPNASVMDAGIYALSTESGCVIGATSSEYLIGKFLTTSNNPFNATNLAIRTGGLPVAFIVGLGMVSGFTYVKKNESCQLISDKGSLSELYKRWEKVGSCELDNNKLLVKGQSSNLKIKEVPIPRTYQQEFNPVKNSLYKVTSPIARYDREAKKKLKNAVFNSFKNLRTTVSEIPNIYDCS